jgi:methionyl aminopeptidase
MAIYIKNADEIAKMRIACNIVKLCFAYVETLIAPGISTGEIEREIVNFLHSKSAKPSFKNYRGFPKAACISINEEVIHGIPGIRRLKSGDIVSIDIGAYIGGFHGDAARTFGVGEISSTARSLIKATEKSFFDAAQFCKAGARLNDVCAAVERSAQASGFDVVREYVGHGIGKDLHEMPNIPNYSEKRKGPKLRAGMTLAIEPMVVAGDFEVITLDDGWTVVTEDGSLAAHYENTVLITNGEPEILTL